MSRRRQLRRPGRPPPRFGFGRSVFWKVAGVLVGVQVATGLMAVALSAYFAYDRSLDLAENSLRLRLDHLAEEVERRAYPLDDGVRNLPFVLRQDLHYRFPDPIFLLDQEGRPLLAFLPGIDSLARLGGTAPPAVSLPDGLADSLQAGNVMVQMEADESGGTWALTPVFNADGYLAGGLLVYPLTRSIDRELADTRAAFERALRVVSALAGLIALILGAFFTWRLVRPLRHMTRRVERIGAGDYAARLEVRSEDEFGRLAAAINHMAAQVQASIERLRATDRLRRELIANVGHDLRTPLAAMLGYVEEAKRHVETGHRDAARETLETAERQGRYLARLVADLFELSLLDSAVPPLRREPIPLGELIHDAARSHRVAFAREGIAFELVVPEALPVLEGDGVRLLRLLDNLLSNARRHTPPGGTVWLHVTLEDGAVCIEVRDTGSGMAPEVLANIFERYYRGTDARTRGDGTGLGLPIARAIARAHGGDLSATSTPGVGSVFTLRLPLQKAREKERGGLRRHEPNPI
ncbi:HAMP domain-containing histidine kinase [Rhodocaloribacter litoris]|uniref:sensor histidine kinase n=1 Tax=Rhodocaloribacter litoris TaxID=2558931 RepID=UPI00141EB826|nr:HAMP domain-containing sensor histidine kinase [Rhodocaloribacter litoris]QXD14271.1 HAMP domain-containing histidine kinase [Rhodocaloribacter litoris]